MELTSQQLQQFSQLSPAAQSAFATSPTGKQYTNIPQAQAAASNTQPQSSNPMQMQNFASYTPSGSALKDTGNALLTGAENLIPSTANLVTGIAHNVYGAVTDPSGTAASIDTAIGHFATGAAYKAAGAIDTTIGHGITKTLTDPAGAFPAFVNYLKQKYSSVGGTGGLYQDLLKQVANDPSGTAVDVSMLLDGTGELLDAAKIGSTAAEGSAAAAGTEALTQAGMSTGGAANPLVTGLKNAAGMTNPLALPFKAAGAVVNKVGQGLQGFENPSEVTDALKNINEGQTANGGTTIETTAGIRSGSPATRAFEGILPKMMFGGPFYRTVTSAIGTLRDASTEIYNSMSDYIGRGSTLTSADTLDKVKGTLGDLQSAAMDAKNKAFQAFRNIPEAMGVTAVPRNAISVLTDGPNSILGQISQLGDPALAARYQKLADGLSASEEGSPITSVIDAYNKSGKGPMFGTLSAADQEKVLTSAGITPADMKAATGVTVGDMMNLSNSVGAKIPESTSEFSFQQAMAIKFKTALQQDIEDSLGSANPEFKSQFDKINAQVAHYKSVIQGDVVNDFIKNPGAALKKLVFNPTSDTSGLTTLKSVLSDTPGNWEAVGGAAIKKMIEDAWTTNKAGEGMFDSSKFNKTFDKINPETLKTLFTPEQLAKLQDFRASTQDLQTVTQKGFSAYNKIIEGSQTAFNMHSFALVSRLGLIGEGAAIALGGGGLATIGTAVLSALSYTFGDLAFSKLVGSDFGQRILSQGLGTGIIGIAQKIEASGGFSKMAADFQQGLSTSQSTQQQQPQGPKDLTPQQLQAFQQLSPAAQAAARQQLSGQYNLPQ